MRLMKRLCEGQGKVGGLSGFKAVNLDSKTRVMNSAYQYIM